MTTKDRLRVLMIFALSILFFHPSFGIESPFVIEEDFEDLNVSTVNFYWKDPTTYQYTCSVSNFSYSSSYGYELCAQEGNHYFYEHPSNTSFHNTTYSKYMLDRSLPQAPSVDATFNKYVFEDEFYLSDYMNISFDAYFLPLGTHFLYFQLRVLNTSNDQMITLPVELSYNYGQSCSLATFSGEQVNATFKKTQFTSQDITESCIPGDDPSLFKVLEYSFRSTRNAGIGGFMEVGLDNIRIDVTNNQLPLYNASLSQEVCLAQGSETNKTIDLDVSAYDPESDDIYYSLKANEDNVITTYSFNDGYYEAKNCDSGYLLLNYLIPLTNLFDNLRFGCFDSLIVKTPDPDYVDISSCDVNFENINNSNFYVDLFPNNLNSLTHMLVYNPNCQDEPETFLKTDFAMRDLLYSTNLYLMKFANNTFNLTFYDNPYSQDYVFKLKFLQNTQDNLSVFVVNGSSESQIMEVNTELSRVGLTNYLGFDLMYDYDLNTFNLTLGLKNGSVYEYQGANPMDNEGKLVKYIGLRIRNKEANYLYHEIFTYGGFTLAPVWSLSVPSEMDIAYLGENTVNFYVTDSYHKDLGVFNWTTLSFIVRYNEDCLGSSPIGNTDPDNIQANKDLLGLFKYMFGNPFKDFLIEVGQYENGKTLVYWMWFILVLLIFIAEYWLTNKLDFTVPLFLSSLIFFFLSWTVGYIGNMVAFGFLMCIPLAGVAAGMFLGGHHAK